VPPPFLSNSVFKHAGLWERARCSSFALSCREKHKKEEVDQRVVQETLQMLRNFCLYLLISEIYSIASWFTGWTVRGSNSDRNKKHLFFRTSRPALGAHSAGTWPPSNAEVKNEWRFTSIPPVFLHGVVSDKFTFSPFCNQFLANGP